MPPAFWQGEAITETLAVRMQAYGGQEVLQLGPVAIATLQPEEVRLRMIAAGINHTDLKIRAKLWPIHRADPFLYTPASSLRARLSRLAPRWRALCRECGSTP